MTNNKSFSYPVPFASRSLSWTRTASRHCRWFSSRFWNRKPITKSKRNKMNNKRRRNKKNNKMRRNKKKNNNKRNKMRNKKRS